ncbi:toxin-antitoxin system YwqK family antitoxin [Andreprevotia chitinilytica]|uniref:toxin-antitoxin system YwqK family antitoxin n=1 Tax=Andreprevotia chitinilytica TaxID=396808 RepID=UPI000A04CE7C
MVGDLSIAEILYETGEMCFRYSRYKASDGSRWIRHGLFRAYHQNGNLASEGHYADGKEHGPWRDYHENGQVAAEGQYENGQETGEWKFWDADGSASKPTS